MLGEAVGMNEEDGHGHLILFPLSSRAFASIRRMSRLALAAACAALLVGVALGQPAETHEQRRARFLQMSADAEAKGLAEPFKGITTRRSAVTGLFPIRSTGVSTGGVRKAAEGFLAALTPDQRDKTVFALDDPEWRKWMNQDYYVRQGVSFLDMTPAQRDAALGLLRASLSAKGLKQTRDIMRLNHTLGELNDNDFDRYGEWRYHITVMGTPSATEPWGWQFDGHHAIVNYFVLADQVVMTPLFAGSEPVDRHVRQVHGHVDSAGRAESRAGDGQRARPSRSARRRSSRCRRPETRTSPRRGRTTSSSTTRASGCQSCRTRSGSS